MPETSAAEEGVKGMGKTGVFLDTKGERYEFLLAGVQVAHVSREQYDPLTQEQREELEGIIWDEVFKMPGLLPESLASEAVDA